MFPRLTLYCNDSNENAASKIPLSHLNASVAKEKMRLFNKKSKVLHNMYISRVETCVSATPCISKTRNKWVRAMICVGYEIYTRELCFIIYIL